MIQKRFRAKIAAVVGTALLAGTLLISQAGADTSASSTPHLDHYLSVWSKLADNLQVDQNARTALHDLVSRLESASPTAKQNIESGLSKLDDTLETGFLDGTAQQILAQQGAKFGWPYKPGSNLLTKIGGIPGGSRTKGAAGQSAPFAQVKANQDGTLNPHNEPSVAVNPTNSQNVIATGNDARLAPYGEVHGGVYVSQDGAQNFHDTLMKSSGFAAYDTSVAFDPSGAAYYLQNYVRFAPGFDVPLSGIEVAKSADSGQTWTYPTRAIETPMLIFSPPYSFDFPLIDKPYLAVGPAAGAEHNSVYAAYTEFHTGFSFNFDGSGPTFEFKETAQLRSVRSADGVMWQAPTNLSPLAYYVDITQSSFSLPAQVVQGASPWVAADGKLYVAYYDSLQNTNQNGAPNGGWLTGQFSPMVISSTDGGVTFSQPSPVATMTQLGGGVFPRGYVLAPTFFRAWSSMFPVLRTNPSNPNEVYATFAADPDPYPDTHYATDDDADIFFAKSTDGGQTWGHPIRVNDDNTTNSQFFPAMAVSPNGTIHITFGDRREDPANTYYNIYHAMSTDGGITFHANDKVSSVASDPNTQYDGMFIGDYFGLAASDAKVYAAWTDTRFNQNQDIVVGSAPVNRLK